MEFHIGINLIEVVKEDGKIYGNGVNIAARLEGLGIVRQFLDSSVIAGLEHEEFWRRVSLMAEVVCRNRRV